MSQIQNVHEKSSVEAIKLDFKSLCSHWENKSSQVCSTVGAVGVSFSRSSLALGASSGLATPSLSNCSPVASSAELVPAEDLNQDLSSNISASESYENIVNTCSSVEGIVAPMAHEDVSGKSDVLETCSEDKDCICDPILNHPVHAVNTNLVVSPDLFIVPTKAEHGEPSVAGNLEASENTVRGRRWNRLAYSLGKKRKSISKKLKNFFNIFKKSP